MENLLIAQTSKGLKLNISIGRKSMGNYWIVERNGVVVTEHLQIICFNNTLIPKHPNFIKIDKRNIKELFGVDVKDDNNVLDIVSYADGSSIPTGGLYQLNMFKGETLSELKEEVLKSIAKEKEYKKKEAERKKEANKQFIPPTTYGEAYNIGGLDYAEEGNWSKPPRY